MDDITLIILVISCCVMSIISSLIGTGIYATSFPKEGDECEGDDINADYAIDSDGACAFVDCKLGYDYDGVACAVSSKTGEDEAMEEDDTKEESDGSAQEITGTLSDIPHSGKGLKPSPEESNGYIEGLIAKKPVFEKPVIEKPVVDKPAVQNPMDKIIVQNPNHPEPSVQNPWDYITVVPISLTDAQAQCYLNRYPDLQDLYGLTNIEAAKKHWIAHGIHENRNYKCETGSNAEEMAKTPRFGSVEMLLNNARNFDF